MSWPIFRPSSHRALPALLARLHDDKFLASDECVSSVSGELFVFLRTNIAWNLTLFFIIYFTYFTLHCSMVYQIYWFLQCLGLSQPFHSNSPGSYSWWQVSCIRRVCFQCERLVARVPTNKHSLKFDFILHYLLYILYSSLFNGISDILILAVPGAVSAISFQLSWLVIMMTSFLHQTSVFPVWAASCSCSYGQT